MEQNDFIEPLRRTQSANITRPHLFHKLPSVRTPSPLHAPPTLMLDNGLGELSSIPSPIVDRDSDDDDEESTSDSDAFVQEHVGHSKSLSVPSMFDPPAKYDRRRDYSPLPSPTRPPSSPPKRALSPPKMILADSKPRPVWIFFTKMGFLLAILESSKR